jgi:hypothetical protein
MDTGIAISLAALAVSIVGTLISLFYTRRSNKLVEEQLDKRRAMGKASTLIAEVMDTIREQTNLDLFHFSPLDFSKDNILEYMHDNRKATVSIDIKPKSISYVSDGAEGDRIVEVKVEDLREVRDKFKFVLSKKLITFDFYCEPEILENSFVELTDSLGAIKSLCDAYESLESRKDTIDTFDPNLLPKFKGILDTMIGTIFEGLTHTHTIAFTSSDKSKEILWKLEDQIFGMKSIQESLNTLSGEICSRLSEIRKEIYLPS